MFNLQLFKLFVVSEVSITHVHSYFGLTMFPSTQNQVRQTGRVNTVEKSQTNATNVTLPQHEPPSTIVGKSVSASGSLFFEAEFS